MPLTEADMQVVSVKDLNSRQALRAAKQIRFAAGRRTATEEASFISVINTVGGRLSYLTKVAKHPDMLGHARQMLDIEKAWLQSRIGLIPDHDDDVMDEVSLRSPCFDAVPQLCSPAPASKNGAHVHGCCCGSS